jgi:hypothetical protein
MYNCFPCSIELLKNHTNSLYTYLCLGHFGFKEMLAIGNDTVKYVALLNGSDGDVLHSELPSFWTLFALSCCNTTLLETWSVSILR